MVCCYITAQTRSLCLKLLEGSFTRHHSLRKPNYLHWSACKQWPFTSFESSSCSIILILSVDASKHLNSLQLKPFTFGSVKKKFSRSTLTYKNLILILQFNSIIQNDGHGVRRQKSLLCTLVYKLLLHSFINTVQNRHKWFELRGIKVRRLTKQTLNLYNVLVLSVTHLVL